MLPSQFKDLRQLLIFQRQFSFANPYVAIWSDINISFLSFALFQIGCVSVQDYPVLSGTLGDPVL